MKKSRAVKAKARKAKVAGKRAKVRTHKRKKAQPPIFMKEVKIMAAAKKRKKHKARRYGFEGFEGKRKKRKARRYGFEGVAGRRKSRRKGRFLGVDSGTGSAVKIALAALGGAVAGSYAANMVPLSAKLKPALPLVAGIGLTMTKFGRKPVFQAMGLGMMVAGGLSLLRQFLPTMPLLAGEVEVDPQSLIAYDGEVMDGEVMDGEDMDGEDMDGESDWQSGEPVGEDDIAGFGGEGAFATSADA